MKHIKNFKLFEYGEAYGFTDQELKTLEYMGFSQIDNYLIYKDDDLEIKISKESMVSSEEIDEWYLFSVEFNKEEQKEIKKSNYYKKSSKYKSDIKSLRFETFEDLLDEINKYI
jgi:hypothetical protein